MRVFSLAAAFLLIATTSEAKPWHGIEPGTSTRAAVVDIFGKPTKSSSTRGVEVLIYRGPAKGTAQAQFELSKTGVVERVIVFPAVKLGREEIEAGYGGRCAPGPQKQPCYLERKTPSGKLYFEYPLLGIVVFFQGDGQQVQSLMFRPEPA